ncbi:MAG: hypothetical protein KF703_09130, partial [Actinobacteria bacterium]|nr:hypothetical protein [Actinomycetota bacterium]
MVLTITLALAQRGMVTRLRSALPYIQRISGGIMVLMGAYLTWYGIYEIRINRDGTASGGGPVDLVTGWSSDVSEAMQNLDTLQVALVLGLVVAVALLVALLRADRAARRAPGSAVDAGSPDQGESRSTDQPPGADASRR